MNFQLSAGQVFGVYKSALSNEHFTSLSVCNVANRKSWITSVAETCNIKPIGVWVIRKVKQEAA